MATIMDNEDILNADDHPLANLSKLKKLNRTTRGTIRQRAPKGSLASWRYGVLADQPLEITEKSLQRKLKRLAPDNRQRVEAVLEQLTGEDKREYVLRLLAGYKVY